MGFPRQEYWSGLPFPPLGDLPHPEIEPAFPAFLARTVMQGKSKQIGKIVTKVFLYSDDLVAI